MVPSTPGCAPPPPAARSSSRPTASYRATSSCTRTCCVTDLLRLVRINNLLLAAVGVLAGGWIALGAVRTPNVLALAAFAVLGLYSPVLKRRGLPGNVAVALLGGLPLIYGAIAVGHAAAGIVPWILAAWIHLVREIVKDIDDQTGDQTLSRRTLPLVLGARPASLVAAGLAAAFVPLSLALPAAAHYRGAYFLIALFAQLVVLAVASRLFTGRLATA